LDAPRNAAVELRAMATSKRKSRQAHQLSTVARRMARRLVCQKVADVVAGTLDEIDDGTTGGAVAATYGTVVCAPLIAAAVLTGAIGKVTSCFGLAS
jgi:hypothetical protein